MNKKIKVALSILFVSIFILGFLIGAQGKRTISSGDDREIYHYLRTFSDVIDIVKKNYVEEVKDKDVVFWCTTACGRV